jgi:hypothetical protein
VLTDRDKIMLLKAALADATSALDGCTDLWEVQADRVLSGKRADWKAMADGVVRLIEGKPVYWRSLLEL